MKGKYILETVLVVSSVILWLVVIFNLLLTLALVRRLRATSPSQNEIGLKSGQPAPDFTAQTLNGEIMTRSTYAGRSIAFLFISIHCAPCHDLLPQLEPLAPKAAQSGVELILVSGDGLKETKAFAEEQNINLPVLVAPRESNSFMEDYKCTATPSYCFIDANAEVISSGYPSLQWGEWKTLVESWTKHDPLIQSKRR